MPAYLLMLHDMNDIEQEVTYSVFSDRNPTLRSTIVAGVVFQSEISDFDAACADVALYVHNRELAGAKISEWMDAHTAHTLKDCHGRWMPKNTLIPFLATGAIPGWRYGIDREGVDEDLVQDDNGPFIVEWVSSPGQVDPIRKFHPSLVMLRYVGPSVATTDPTKLGGITKGFVCEANRDGECDWSGCPQTQDGEPAATGRHCPYDIDDDDDV